MRSKNVALLDIQAILQKSKVTCTFFVNAGYTNSNYETWLFCCGYAIIVVPWYSTCVLCWKSIVLEQRLLIVDQGFMAGGKQSHYNRSAKTAVSPYSATENNFSVSRMNAVKLQLDCVNQFGY